MCKLDFKFHLTNILAFYGKYRKNNYGCLFIKCKIDMILKYDSKRTSQKYESYLKP